MTNAKTRTLNGALTVRELMETLEGYDPDARVVFVCDYGDYCHTQQALPVGEALDVTTKHLYESAYSGSGLALMKDDPDDDPDEDEEETETEEELPVVVLR